MIINYTEDSKTGYSNRHPSYVDAPGMCWYMFRSLTDPETIPSSMNIESVDKNILDHLTKTAKLVSKAKLFSGNSKTKKKSGFDAHSLLFDEELGGEIYIFLISNSYFNITINSPVVIKLVESNKNSFTLQASSFDSVALESVIGKMFKEFGKKPDYDNETFFGILVNSGDGIDVKQLPIDDKFSKKLDINLNYGKDFDNHHKQIVSKLKETNNGLFIFHGTAGTGKTTYIKYLAKIFGGERTFIFIPTTFIDSLTSPNIIPVLLEHPNSVLVLEDAEKAVISREENHGNESLVSSLLNIGDGILGSMLNLSIILTFNTARENVDKALLRKGRLHYEHEFDKLTVSDAQTLVDKLKKNIKVTERMSLSEIYNIEAINNHKEKERPKVGFAQ